MIAATNQNLEEMVAQGKFKDDLYQRLSVLQIQLPPLKERKEDIPELLEHFAEVHRNGMPKLIFLPETIATIQRYPFPGNVRELSNLVLYLYTMMEGQEVSPLDLPPKFQGLSTPEISTKPAIQLTRSETKNFYKAVEEFRNKHNITSPMITTEKGSEAYWFK